MWQCQEGEVQVGNTRRKGAWTHGSKGLTRTGREATCQRHINWEQNKMMALIKGKQSENATQKQLMDLIMHMVPIIVWWNKITNEL